MSDPVDIEVRIKAARAEVTLAKLNAALKITGEREKQVALKTQIMNQRLSNAAKVGNRVGKGFKVANIAMASFIGNITSRAVSSGVTTIVNGFRNMIEEGRQFEAALIQIQKTTGLSTGATEKFGKEIIKIGKRIPVATKSLLDIAKVAGQLGIKGEENLAAFTETMAKLQLATDIAGEEGSQSVAKILTITGELEENGTDNINKFGSVITQLGNNFAATESQILKVANEVAKGTTVFNVSSEDVLGLATAFKVTGSEAEISGSTIQEIFKKIGQATEKGGGKLTKFSQAAGLTEKAFTTLFRQDPTAAFVKLTEGLGKAGLSGEKLNAKMAELGFSNKRVVKSLGPLITRYQILADTIAQAREEAEKQTALDDETRKAQRSLDADIQKLSNSFTEMSNALFNEVGPALRATVRGLTSMTEALSKLIASGNLSKVISWGKNMLLFLMPALRIVDFAAKRMFDTFKDNSIEPLDEDTKNYLNSLGELTGGIGDVTVPMLALNKEVKGLRDNYVSLTGAQDDLASSSSSTTKEITLFEQEKTKELKKFFKEEEQAKLQANFAIQKSEEEKLAFTRFVTQEGVKRRSELFKATIGLDRATLDSKRQSAAELKKLNDDQKKREKDLFDSEVSLSEQRRQLELLTNGERTILKEDQLQETVEFLSREEQAKAQAHLESITNETERQQALTDIRTLSTKNRQQRLMEAEKNITNIIEEEAKKRADLEKNAGAAQVRRLQGTFGIISTLQNSHNKELAVLGKAAAIGQITINTAQGVSEAFKLGPILGPILAPIVIAAGVAQAANVAGAKFEQGGIVGGSSFTGDRIPARVNSGEMILNRSQQKQLFNMANGSGSQNQSQEITSNITVVLDGEVVGEAVSRQVANGLVLGEVQ